MLRLKPQTERHIVDMAAEYNQTVDDFLEVILQAYRSLRPNADTVAAMQEESATLPRYQSPQDLFDELEKAGQR